SSASKRKYDFFVQAEDGIRDRNVTGVQTCALPIWNVRKKKKKKRQDNKKSKKEKKKNKKKKNKLTQVQTRIQAAQVQTLAQTRIQAVQVQTLVQTQTQAVQVQTLVQTLVQARARIVVKKRHQEMDPLFGQ